MKEAKEGTDAGTVCMDSLESFMSSMISEDTNLIYN